MTAAGWIAWLIIGILGGYLAMTVRLRGRLMPGGVTAGIIVGLIGAYLGGVFLGQWGWVLGGLNVVGSIIGALVIAYAVELFGPRTTPQH